MFQQNKTANSSDGILQMEPYDWIDMFLTYLICFFFKVSYYFPLQNI